MKKNLFLGLLLSVCSLKLFGQWQQEVDYFMDVTLDVNTHKMEGYQKLTYTNNSPDTLKRLFYHLYFNAFQPNSMMDIRSRTIRDPNRLIMSRISRLEPDEIGYHDIRSLKMDGDELSFEVEGTILEVELNEPILPQSQVELEMEFESQVPVQIRRSGRDNAEGIDYSMSQWYPKLCAYDEHGWHSNPYVAREFYGVWGDFEVKISIDADYIVAASGEEIILSGEERIKGGSSGNNDRNRIWHFEADMVHDFVWAADPDYKKVTHLNENGTLFQFYFQENENTEHWAALPEIMEKCLEYLNERYGAYPYPVFSFIQGGDGGMEYPMATLITGERSFMSLVGVCVHEFIHSWFPMLMGVNESKYSWIDEGFTTYLTRETMNYLKDRGMLGHQRPGDRLYQDIINGYIRFAQSGAEEPLSTHADHFQTNTAYGIAAYTKGAVFLIQLRYIIGEENFQKTMLRFFENWKYRHPTGDDFIREAEKESGMELHWFEEYFVNTTYTIDYSIHRVKPMKNNRTYILLRRSDKFPMPVDLLVSMKDGSEKHFTIPLRMMRSAKETEREIRYEVLPDWPWTHPTYEIALDLPWGEIESLEIDPSNRLADKDRSDNVVILDH